MHRKVLLFFISLAMAFAPALSSEKKSKAKTKTKTASSVAIKRGKELYRLYQCADCHYINNEGNKQGISLDKIGTKRTSKFLLEQILDPEKHVEKNTKNFNGDPNLMPSQHLEKDEAEAIVTYLKTLK